MDAESVCGDGIRNGLEQCDDGAMNATVPNACRPDCTLPRCGDGTIDSGEACDDANTIAFDGCLECRPETSECLVVHSGNMTGSSFTSMPIRADGSLGTPVGITTTATAADRASHSLAACSGFLFAATNDAIQTLRLDARGVPVMESETTRTGARELLCSGGSLYSPRALETEVELTAFDVGTLGALEEAASATAPFTGADEPSVDRFVPFAGPDAVVVAGFPPGSALGEMLIARFSTSGALALQASVTTMGTATEGVVSADGTSLVGTGARIADQSCVASWSAESAGGPISNCDAFGGAGSLLLANDDGTRGWFSTDSFLGTGSSIVGFRREGDVWESLEQVEVSGPASLVSARAGAFVLAVGRGDVAVLLREGDRLSGPVRVTPYAALGQVRGVAVVPCVAD